MSPDDPEPPGPSPVSRQDWEFPPVEPAEPGFLPADAAPRTTFLPAGPAHTAPVPVVPAAPADPDEKPAAEPAVAADALPVEDAPPVGDGPTVEDPPSAGVLPVPRRTAVSGDPVSPVRALAGAAVAVAGVLLGIGALLWATDPPRGSPTVVDTQTHSSSLTAATPSALLSPSAEPTSPASVVSSPSAVASPTTAPMFALTVLNNSNVNGLAARAAAKYHAAGWPIKLTGAFRGRIPVTTVYYAPGQLASAQLLQRQFPAIARVRPRFATLPGSGLTVVVTRDYRP